ncbi:MAG: DUF6463 family protein [Paludibacteraceae bacterium]|nr:DUF6463 family protein [Paludibacteraceae bacterium]
MKILQKVTNGILLVIIGILHTQLVVSPDGCGKQFFKFSESYFFKISSGLDQLPAEVGKTDFETFATFWFFYFGILIIPLGLLVHSIEKSKKTLPHSFTISYFIVVLIGCYMIPKSGMTFFMLPQAIYMLVSNYLKARKAGSSH